MQYSFVAVAAGLLATVSATGEVSTIKDGQVSNIASKFKISIQKRVANTHNSPRLPLVPLLP